MILKDLPQRQWAHIAKMLTGDGLVSGDPCNRCQKNKWDCIVYPAGKRVGGDGVMKCARCLSTNYSPCKAGDGQTGTEELVRVGEPGSEGPNGVVEKLETDMEEL